MPRQKRFLESNVVYHVFNRRTDCQRLFESPDDYDQFLELMTKGRRKYPVRQHAFCLMSTHFHFALSAQDPVHLARYLRWLCTTHAVRFRIQSGTRGNGHVYQDRYKAVPALDFVHYLTLIRYIEGNPLESGLVERAEHWRWSSLAERITRRRGLIDADQWELPSDWVEIVNSSTSIVTLVHEWSCKPAGLAVSPPRIVEGVTTSDHPPAFAAAQQLRR
jgi:putative transposase